MGDFLKSPHPAVSYLTAVVQVVLAANEEIAKKLVSVLDIAA